MNDVPFPFVVTRCRFVSNVSEAIRLSPTTHQLIQTGITMQEFVIVIEY
jgi:hypothetical protein